MDASERRKRASNEADDWFARLQAGAMERAERQQFVEWLRESSLHVTEMLRVAQIHGELKQFEHWARISTGPKAAEDNVVHLPTPPEDGSKGPDVQPIGASSARMRLFAVAAAIVLIVAAAIVLPKIRGQVIETERGERREIVLNDGSILQVDPETRLRVKYAAALRQVFLERGRALFHVAKNAQRPFLVKAEDTTVRAVGTVFGVEQQAQGVIVTVAEGKVAVYAPSFKRSPSPLVEEANRESTSHTIAPRRLEREVPVRREGELASSAPPQGERSLEKASMENEPTLFLTANQQVTVPRDGAAYPARAVDSHQALAWAEGRLIFQNDELRKVIADFNRYNRVQLTVQDDALAAKPVSGVFNASDPEAFIAFLQSVTTVTIVRDGDRSITIRAARSP